MNYDSLFTPFSIGKCEIKNRIVMSAMGTLMSNRDGTFSEDEIAYFEARAKGGTGMIIVGQGYLTADLGQGVFQHLVERRVFVAEVQGVFGVGGGSLHAVDDQVFERHRAQCK